MKPLYICFEDKIEYILLGKTTENFSIGKLMFSFLDFDFERAESEIKAAKEAFVEVDDIESSTLTGDFDEKKNYLILPAAYQKITNEMKELHPYLFQMVDRFLEQFIDEAYPSMPVMADYAHRIFLHYPETPMTPKEINIFASYADMPTPDKDLIEATNRFTDKLIELLAQLKNFKMDLLEMIRFSLDTNGNYTVLDPDQRYYLMQASGFEPYMRCKTTMDSVRIERKMLESIELPYAIAEITEDVIERLQNSEVYSYSFYTSNDIRALVMLEFDYMCANNMEVRRCANCDGYFHPFSNRAIYCERIFKNDKMCKELAAAVKYREAAKKDEASEYLRRLQNTYNMRCQRSADFTMMDRRDEWKVMAQEKLREFHSGEIDLEKFKEAIKLPVIK